MSRPDWLAGAGAVLALWNDVDEEVAADYEDWHANEHVPERLTVPGMLGARRFEADGRRSRPRFLTLYALHDAQVLQSAPYLRLLSHPTPASARMRPHLRNLSRWVCRVQQASLRWIEAPVAVHTGAHAPAPGGEANALLVAQRLPDAPGLPWLAAGQAAAVQGTWLVLRSAGDGDAGPAADMDVCRPLPIAQTRC